MSPEEAIGVFMFGLYQLHFDNLGLQYDRCDPDDLNAVGTAAVMVYRIADKSETPSDCALSRLCVLTGALLVAPRGDDGARIVREWLDAKSEYLALQLAGNC
jgi:hypothetical protein